MAASRLGLPARNSSIGMSPLALLQGMHADTMLLGRFEPPLARASTWSRFSGTPVTLQ